MSEHLDYDGLRADTVRQVAELMAAAAITAPESGGQLFLAGKPLGIAVGSAATTAAIHSIHCRCQTRVAVALSLSLTHRAIRFDRRMPDIDFDTLDLPGTGTLPVGVEGASRYGGARNKQEPRRPIGGK